MFRIVRYNAARTDGTRHVWYEVREVPPIEAEKHRLQVDNRTVFSAFEEAQRAAISKNQEPDEAPPALKVGSVVRLKSGGPDMTIEKIGEKTDIGWPVWVAWFPGQDEYGAWRSALTTSFQGESLELVGSL